MPAASRQFADVGRLTPAYRDVAAANKGRLRRVRKSLVLATDASWRRAARYGVAAAVEHRHVPFGPSFATIVDVGAHHGQFALLMRALYPHARVVCVEPLPDAARRLRLVHGADDHVTVLPVAVAAEAGRRCLHVSQKSDSSSLLPILTSYVSAFPGTAEASTVEIEARTLDELIGSGVARPALLKIDVQGGEREVIVGASAVLREVDAVFVECSFVEFYRGQALAGEILGALVPHGLRLTGVYSVVRDERGRCLQADFLFHRAPRSG